MSESSAKRGLRIGIVTDGLVEREVDGEVRIANGGVGVYIDELIRHMAETDSCDQLYLIHYGPARLPIYRHPRVRPIFLKQSRPKILRWVIDWPHRPVFRTLKLDLLHYPNQFGGLFLPKSMRHVSTLHDLTPLLFPSTHPLIRRIAYRLFARPSLARSDFVITVSESSKRDLITYGVRPEHIAAIPEGVRTNFSPADPSPTFISENGLTRSYILTVGVLEPRKNHRLLVEALGELIERGHDLDLVIVGRKGWRWGDLFTRSNAQKLKPRVRIIQDVSDEELVQYYRHAAVFAYPSLYEGFGLPVLEAMACGTPVVSSNTSSLPEVGGTAALYADPNDSKAFAEQISRILADDALRVAMVEKGLGRARQLSWGHTAEATLELYRLVCQPVPSYSPDAQPIAALS